MFIRDFSCITDTAFNVFLLPRSFFPNRFQYCSWLNKTWWSGRVNSYCRFGNGWWSWTRILGFASVIFEVKYVCFTQPFISYILPCRTELVSVFGTTIFAKSIFPDVKIIFILVFFVVQTFFVGAKCRSLPISIPYTFITRPLCLEVSFPISSMLAFCHGFSRILPTFVKDHSFNFRRSRSSCFSGENLLVAVSVVSIYSVIFIWKSVFNRCE